MQNPKELKKEDFVVNFESKGLPFMFVDISVTNYYKPFLECITYGDLKKTRDLMAKRTLVQMSQEGKSRTSSGTQEKINALNDIVEKLLGKSHFLAEAEIIRKEDAVEVLSLMGDVCEMYAYFDANYWEGAFEDASAQEAIALVQAYKNVIRGKFETIFFNPDSILMLLAGKVSSQFGTPINFLLLCKEKEFISVFDGVSVSEALFDERKRGYFYYKSGNDWCFLEGKEALEAIAIFEDKVEVAPAVFAGKVANRGPVVRGRACLITRDFGGGDGMRTQMREMLQGDILVSETTDPEMMEACRKSAAMVADVGGMLSHTAITARELGIPCIVQTGNASKFIKNGDIIEVDTNSGQVRILEQS